MSEFNEPWKIQAYSGSMPYFLLTTVGDADHKVYLAVGSEISGDHSIERAQRIVACVNFCRNMPTEFLADRMLSRGAAGDGPVRIVGDKE